MTNSWDVDSNRILYLFDTIKMETLIKLLNEYRAEHDVIHIEYSEKDLDSLWLLQRFVRWLVENNKINYKDIVRTWYEIEDWKFNYDDDYYCLLRTLSTQAEPIEFLISILK